MKKILIGLLAIFILIALTACGAKGKNAESVAKEFFTALQTQDFDTAKKLSTEESAGMLTLIEGFMVEGNEDMNNRFGLVSVEETGDTAAATFEAWNEASPDDKDTETMSMVKVDGDWKKKVEKE